VVIASAYRADDPGSNHTRVYVRFYLGLYICSAVCQSLMCVVFVFTWVKINALKKFKIIRIFCTIHSKPATVFETRQRLSDLSVIRFDRETEERQSRSCKKEKFELKTLQNVDENFFFSPTKNFRFLCRKKSHLKFNSLNLLAFGLPNFLQVPLLIISLIIQFF
jgi:hypothetical protein